MRGGVNLNTQITSSPFTTVARPSKAKAKDNKNTPLFFVLKQKRAKAVVAPAEAPAGFINKKEIKAKPGMGETNKKTRTESIILGAKKAWITPNLPPNILALHNNIFVRIFRILPLPREEYL